MKLMVSGIGGVGGYLASVLCANYKEVTLIARKARKEALLKNGLVLHSKYFGEHVSHPAVTDNPASAGIQDIIFVCVKNYSLEEALLSLLPCIDDHTIVALIMNGVDHLAVAQKIITHGHLVDAAIYINSAYNPDYSIQQNSDFARLFIGSDDKDAARKVFTVLDHEGFERHLAEDIKVQIWNKFITNCAFNVITAYYEKMLDEIFALPDGKQEFHTLLTESHAVAKALGINVATDLAEKIYDDRVNRKSLHSTSSLARDVIARRQSELETFSGYLVRAAHELQLSVPLSEKMYKAIKERLAH